MGMENNHNHNGEEGVIEQRHKLSPEQVEDIIKDVSFDLEEAERALLGDESEYFVVTYPNKTVYIPKWTKIPYAQNVSGDPHHARYVFVGDEDVKDVLKREIQTALKAHKTEKTGGIDKTKPIE